MRKLFVPVLALTALMFAYSPIAIANAPYESTMRLVQKIFYYHFPAWMALTVSVTVCTVASALYLFKGSARADRREKPTVSRNSRRVPCHMAVSCSASLSSSATPTLSPSSINAG